VRYILTAIVRNPSSIFTIAARRYQLSVVIRNPLFSVVCRCPLPVVVFYSLGVVRYPSPAARDLLAVIIISYPSASVTRRYLYPSVDVICRPSLSESVSSRYVLPVAICHPLPVIRYPDNGCRYPLTLFGSHCLILIRSPAFAIGCPLPAIPTRCPSLSRYLLSVATHYPLPVTPTRQSYPFIIDYYLL
jgi:hypothetical protein